MRLQIFCPSLLSLTRQVHLLISKLPGEFQGDGLTENQPSKRKKWLIFSQIIFPKRLTFCLHKGNNNKTTGRDRTASSVWLLQGREQDYGSPDSF